MKPTAILVALVAAIPMTAARIDVTGENSAWVHTGAHLEVQFGVWNYGHANPLFSPYPTQISFQLSGQDSSSDLLGIPGSSLDYYSGYLWYAVLESIGGEYSFPLVDSWATQLGLPAGYLLVLPGTFTTGSGESLQVGVSQGSVALTEEESQLLFGTNLSRYSSAARIRLQNMGVGVTIGGNANYIVRNWISEPGIAGLGEVQTSGITGSVVVSNPEPATWLMLGGAIALLLVRRRRLPSIRFRT